jgi:hypothetical protein
MGMPGCPWGPSAWPALASSERGGPAVNPPKRRPPPPPQGSTRQRGSRAPPTARSLSSAALRSSSAGPTCCCAWCSRAPPARRARALPTTALPTATRCCRSRRCGPSSSRRGCWAHRRLSSCGRMRRRRTTLRQRPRRSCAPRPRWGRLWLGGLCVNELACVSRALPHACAKVEGLAGPRRGALPMPGVGLRVSGEMACWLG